MTSPDQVTVTPTGPSAYRVETADGTAHDVTVPEALLSRLDVAGLDESTLVRESFAFLLEREPATSILSSFSLEVIGRYFPEYEEVTRDRLARPSD